jgi:hypothetical protein
MRIIRRSAPSAPGARLVPHQMRFAHVARNSRPAAPALLMRPALPVPGGRPLRDPAVRDPAAPGPEPRRCHIAVVLTTAMPHRCGCAGHILVAGAIQEAHAPAEHFGGRPGPGQPPG